MTFLKFHQFPTVLLRHKSATAICLATIRLPFLKLMYAENSTFSCKIKSGERKECNYVRVLLSPHYIMDLKVRLFYEFLHLRATAVTERDYVRTLVSTQIDAACPGTYFSGQYMPAINGVYV